MKKPLTKRQLAIKAGKKTYFTGKACERGHVAVRDTLSAKCSECHKINARESIARARGRIRLAIRKAGKAKEK
jgi:formate-dependent nitrite reductase cytochrome c552 subunit